MRLVFLTEAKTGKGMVLKIGKYIHPVFGKFTITKEHLKKAVKLFKEGIRPEPPTKLVVDYNHGTAHPQSPEAGKSAGTVEDLYLENDGKELWAEIDWTETAREYIEKKEYLYLSAEFTEHYKHKKTGEDLGFALLAIALTNRPFIEGQPAVSLAEVRDEEGIQNPYPNEHSCRLNNPDKYEKFARKNGEQEH